MAVAFISGIIYPVVQKIIVAQFFSLSAIIPAKAICGAGRLQLSEAMSAMAYSKEKIPGKMNFCC